MVMLESARRTTKHSRGLRRLILPKGLVLEEISHKDSFSLKWYTSSQAMGEVIIYSILLR